MPRFAGTPPVRQSRRTPPDDIDDFLMHGLEPERVLGVINWHLR
ncbi:hypothetical protein [Shinella pollutisoli]|uniref:Uncharacterized protein n=1 Tax=Shinella pollutisoli TaxID=2250594 RepID=A0ABV7DMF7_9HYPH|nr:hypothetical protein [Shinella pollutisoli]